MDDAAAARAELERYVDLLSGRGRGGGWLEVRHRTAAGMRQAFFDVDAARDRLAAHVAALAAAHDVYVGAALRSRQGGDRGSVGKAWVVWADCDSPAALERLVAFRPAPSLVVASGTPGHVHAYWALSRPAGAVVVEDANRRLAGALSADRACVDASRILRPPGTLNHRDGAARPVRIVGASGSPALELDVVLAGAPRREAPRRDVVLDLPRWAGDDPLLSVSARVYVPALLGTPLGRDSKASCPFHEDRTPSLHAYVEPERGWFCFGCRRGGSIYDFGAQLWGLETRGADFLRLRERLGAELGRGRARQLGREL